MGKILRSGRVIVEDLRVLKQRNHNCYMNKRGNQRNLFIQVEQVVVDQPQVEEPMIDPLNVKAVEQAPLAEDVMVLDDMVTNSGLYHYMVDHDWGEIDLNKFLRNHQEVFLKVRDKEESSLTKSQRKNFKRFCLKRATNPFTFLCHMVCFKRAFTKYKLQTDLQKFLFLENFWNEESTSVFLKNNINRFVTC